MFYIFFKKEQSNASTAWLKMFCIFFILFQCVEELINYHKINFRFEKYYILILKFELKIYNFPLKYKMKFGTSEFQFFFFFYQDSSSYSYFIKESSLVAWASYCCSWCLWQASVRLGNVSFELLIEKTRTTIYGNGR